MRREFNEQVAFRLTTEALRRLVALADAREVDVADIGREAVREYLARRPSVNGVNRRKRREKATA